MVKKVNELLRTLINAINSVMFRICSSDMRIWMARRWGVKIGAKCRIYACNFGSEPYLVSIGNHTEITAGVSFITHDGATWIFRENEKFRITKYGPIIIKDNCMIGINSIIMPNVTIGSNSIVGAGSVVTKDVPPNSVFAGNPAKFICTIDQYLEKCDKKDTGYIPTQNKKNVLINMFKEKLQQ
jgi:acetyltransferase-like isoleucine patch superfamily enzyme